MKKYALEDEFVQLLSVEIKNHYDELLFLREILIRFKNNGMNKDSMYENLEKLRSISDSETEDIILELMDFVVGYCNSGLSIFNMD